MVSFDIVFPKKVYGREYLVVWHHGCSLILVSVFLEVLLYATEVEMCFQYSLASSPMPAYKEVQCCCCIKQTTPKHDATEPLLWHILVEEKQVIAEVEVGLSWTLFRKCAAANMIDNAFGNADYAVTTTSESPA